MKTDHNVYSFKNLSLHLHLQAIVQACTYLHKFKHKHTTHTWICTHAYSSDTNISFQLQIHASIRACAYVHTQVKSSMQTYALILTFIHTHMKVFICTTT